ncbi:Kdo hydroxylase family protein [Massilia horti]|uniref:3-deoxy-D-manno-oct-2-ulosonic acid (Kdo) hydroxylase n=1 Tax=Massilia horti TaxID=2562153 RepID=A0A4Y9SVQ7_9BURK|nr:Kdo hydroxylase family protein [Massilia horti]TFW30875.1 3-deoxy-D-manno-oct-2-ulosonic acid (Kdo) hydroxylase [Massilia horti]
MDQPIIEIADLPKGTQSSDVIAALESGKVLYLPTFGFTPTSEELRLFRPDMRDPKSRNISLDANGGLKGAIDDAGARQALTAMMVRFREQAEGLLGTLAPCYTGKMKRGPVSFRPSVVETRVQSWRADDRRLHVDAFPSRPNRGERLLRVFYNANPDGVPRVWRVGEPFETVAGRFLPKLKPYSRWQARALSMLGVTKSLRSEYDHLMLQLHDAMKSDADYQKNAPQVKMPFPAGSAWVCFSDQTAHAAMSGQYMIELTVQLPPSEQYDPQASPLAILSRMTGRQLV